MYTWMKKKVLAGCGILLGQDCHLVDFSSMMEGRILCAQVWM